MTENAIPKPPTGTKATGRKLWNSVLSDYELSEHELTLLVQAVRTADVCEDLQQVVAAEGALVTTRLGERKTHPALVELRNERALLGRLIVALRVPIGDAEMSESSKTPAPRRTARRSQRGFYRIDGGVA